MLLGLRPSRMELGGYGGRGLSVLEVGQVSLRELRPQARRDQEALLRAYAGGDQSHLPILNRWKTENEESTRMDDTWDRLFGRLCGYYDSRTGEQTATAIVVKERLVEHVGDRLIIDMKLALDELSLPANRSLVCTPLIERGDSVRALPPVIVNGRNRQIQYDRSGRDAAANGEFVLRRYNGKEQTFDYHASIPFAKWMERSEVSLVADFCGCGWEALSNDKSPLFPIRIAEPVVLRPLLAYVTPEAERVKERVKEGSAFLDFPVNRTEIYPEYRDNPSELRKILETVSSVKEDPYATITEVYIKGFASPEGTYKHNTYLAEHRAKALIEYVKGLYHFEQARFTVDFEPEDWAGLEKRVENSSLADKEELLAIIRADEPKDYDRREAKLKALNGGDLVSGALA